MNRNKIEMVSYCMECECKLHETELKDIMVCMNRECVLFDIYVGNWYNFEVEV